jgi:aerobic-type carbon monoxide dehydrogenase small subunit (CoxS/CutS family)
VAYELTVNGATTTVDGPGMRPLLSVLRDELGLRGSKLGCSEGRCGACTVLVDGEPVVSCLYPVALADGHAVRTIEGLAGPEDPLTAVQEALLEHGGVQCGACIPGVVMSLTALLERHEIVDEPAVLAALSGNICRCTGYRNIVNAALAAAAHTHLSAGGSR